MIPSQAFAGSQSASTSAASATAVLPAQADVLRDMRRVADWQLSNMNYHVGIPQPTKRIDDPLDWQQATFWIGLTALADRDRAYAKPILKLGREQQWKLGPAPFFADDQLIAQTWEWSSRNGGGRAALVPAQRYFDNVFANRPKVDLDFRKKPAQGLPPCIDRWCWCDALFMAPPTLLKLGKTLRDPRYAKFVHEEYRATTDYLFDRKEHLFFRDSRFFDRRDPAGNKLFWSRGNGWVLAGLARVIETLDRNDPNRAYYVSLFRELAARVVSLQKPDGYWPASMLDKNPTLPESSGTALFTYGLAWGVNAGILTDPGSRQAALKGWSALTRAIQPDGMLGWVQQASDRPDSVAQHQTQFFGAGAFLLAGSAMYDLTAAKRRR